MPAPGLYPRRMISSGACLEWPTSAASSSSSRWPPWWCCRPRRAPRSWSPTAVCASTARSYQREMDARQGRGRAVGQRRRAVERSAAGRGRGPRAHRPGRGRLEHAGGAGDLRALDRPAHDGRLHRRAGLGQRRQHRPQRAPHGRRPGRVRRLLPRSHRAARALHRRVLAVERGQPAPVLEPDRPGRLRRADEGDLPGDQERRPDRDRGLGLGLCQGDGVRLPARGLRRRAEGQLRRPRLDAVLVDAARGPAAARSRRAPADAAVADRRAGVPQQRGSRHADLDRRVRLQHLPDR